MIIEKFHSNINSKLYLRPKLNLLQFGIQHFAGKVMYSVEGFLEKNRQFLPMDVIKLLTSSNITTVKHLFQYCVNKNNTFCSMPISLHHLQPNSCSKVNTFTDDY